MIVNFNPDLDDLARQSRVALARIHRAFREYWLLGRVRDDFFVGLVAGSWVVDRYRLIFPCLDLIVSVRTGVVGQFAKRILSGRRDGS